MERSIAIIAGALFGAYVGLDSSSIVSACIALLALLLLAHRLPRNQLISLAGVAVVAALVGNQTGRAPEPLSEPAGAVVLEGRVTRTHCRWDSATITAQAQERALHRDGMRCSLVLDDVTIDATPTPGRIPLNGWREDFAPFDIGDRLRCRAKLTATRTQSNPGTGWAGRQPWLRFRARATDVEPPSALKRGNAWNRLRRTLGDGIEGPADVVALYRAVLLGDRTGLTVEMRDAFVDTGTAHLLAISGLHLAVLAGVLFRLLVLLFMLGPQTVQTGRPRVPAAALTILIVWFYTFLVGQHSQATQRAAIFITVFLGALVLSKRSTPGRSLWVAMAGLTLLDPRALLSPGFQLSFAAAAGLIAAAPHLRRLDGWLDAPGRFPEAYWARPVRVLAALAGTTLVCHFATAPLASAWFGQTSWAGLWVNLAAVPLASLLVVPLGALWMASAAIAPGLGDVVAPLAIAPAQWLIDAVTSWGDLWGSTQGAAMPHWVGILWALAFIAAVLWTRRSRWCAVGLAMAALTVGWVQAPPASVLKMTTLDVGHGDAVVVQAPGGATMLVDTGGAFDRRRRGAAGLDRRATANESLANWTVLPALGRLGVSELDVLVITHAHLDHIGAALRLVRRLHVRELWMSPCSRHKSVARRLISEVLAQGGVVKSVTAGMKAKLGGATIHALWPDIPSVADERGRCLVGLNDGSVVLRVDYAGRRLLLTGDIEEESEEVLVELDPAELEADVLKVPHHGSRTSSTAAFVAAVAPRWAIVPGVLDMHSRRMPPHVSVLSGYRQRGTHLFVTGRDGAVTVTVDAEGRLNVRTVAPVRALPP